MDPPSRRDRLSSWARDHQVYCGAVVVLVLLSGIFGYLNLPGPPPPPPPGYNSVDLWVNGLQTCLTASSQSINEVDVALTSNIFSVSYTVLTLSTESGTPTEFSAGTPTTYLNGTCLFRPVGGWIAVYSYPQGTPMATFGNSDWMAYNGSAGPAELRPGGELTILDAAPLAGLNLIMSGANGADVYGNVTL